MGAPGSPLVSHTAPHELPSSFHTCAWRKHYIRERDGPKRWAQALRKWEVISSKSKRCDNRKPKATQPTTNPHKPVHPEGSKSQLSPKQAPPLTSRASPTRTAASTPACVDRGGALKGALEGATRGGWGCVKEALHERARWGGAPGPSLGCVCLQVPR